MKTKIEIQRNFYISEYSIDNWAFWQFEENIKIINEIIEEEKQKSESNKNSNPNNFDPSGAIRNIENATKNLPKY